MSLNSRILIVFIIISLVSVPGFTQEADPKKETTEEPSKSAGLRKIPTQSRWSDLNIDVRIDQAELEANIEAAVANAMKSVEVALDRLEIHIEPIEINLRNLDRDINPIVINIPHFDIDIEPIEIDLGDLEELEHMDIDIDVDDNDFDRDENDNDFNNEEWNRNKDKDKADKMKDKSEKEKDKSDKEKSKGLKKLN